MKTDFQFSNLLGTVYGRGNLLFAPDGTCLLSPVGNRVSVFDLVNNRSWTLPFAHRKNIARLALNPRGNLLLTVDEESRAILTNVPRRIAVYHFTFRDPVTALEFAPSGRHFAVGIGRRIEVWHTPSTPDSTGDGSLEFAPFVQHRTYVGHYDTIQHIQWSSDSRFFLSASKDLSARIWSLDPTEGFEPTTLSGHKQGVRAAWFSKDQETIWTVSKDGAVFRWEYMAKPPKEDDEEMADEEDMRWRIANRHYFMQNNAHVTCTAFHAPSNLLVTGFSNGIFMIHELPDFTEIHTLSISQTNIDFVTINSTGLWLAFGSSELGQLLVWEWQSESYILKQQSHHDSLNSLVYSPSGQHIITCADDGKVKVWDVRSGFCVVTFTEHSSGVTACEFAKHKSSVLFTSSLDGSVRAWDLIRYRNFRTFTAPQRTRFSCLAIDPSGEVVCACSHDTDKIYVWSVQTGQLLDQLAGHEGPISSLAFSSDGNTLVSGSWDNTVRIWNIFARTQTSEPLQLQANVLALSFRPDSKQIAVSTLDGHLAFWNVSEGIQTSGLDGRRDISGGRRVHDRRTAANAAGTKSFTCLTYSADGTCVLASGDSKYICLYECRSGMLLKKFAVSTNLSLSGTQEFLNSRNLTEAGPRELLDEAGEASDLEDRVDRSLPGSKRGDKSVRRLKPEVRVTGVAFSPSGRNFCAATTEGLLVYGLDEGRRFDPFDLDIDVTPKTTVQAIERREYLKALVMAFRLNLDPLISRAFFGVPPSDIEIVVREMPDVYLSRLMRVVARQADESPHLEFCLRWIQTIFTCHGRVLKERRGEFASEVRGLMRAVNNIERDIRKVAESNKFMVEYLLKQPLKKKAIEGNEDILMLEDGENGDVARAEDDEMEDEGEWLGLEE